MCVCVPQIDRYTHREIQSAVCLSVRTIFVTFDASNLSRDWCRKRWATAIATRQRIVWLEFRFASVYYLVFCPNDHINKGRLFTASRRRCRRTAARLQTKAKSTATRNHARIKHNKYRNWESIRCDIIVCECKFWHANTRLICFGYCCDNGNCDGRIQLVFYIRTFGGDVSKRQISPADFPPFFSCPHTLSIGFFRDSLRRRGVLHWINSISLYCFVAPLSVRYGFSRIHT